MNHKKISILIFLSVFFICNNLFAQLIDKPAASVNYTKPELISVKQLDAQVRDINILRQRSGQNAVTPTKEDKLKVLDMIISDKLIMQAAESKSIVATEAEIEDAVNTQKAQIEKQNNRQITDIQFKNAIETQTGYTWEEYKKQLEKKIVEQKFILSEKKDEIQKNIKLPDFSEVESFYRQNKTQFSNPDMVRYSQIFISTVNLSGDAKKEAERKADEAYKKYVNGTATFEQLVNDYTEDPNAKYRNGDSGYISYNDPNANAYLGKDFIDKLFAMKKDEVKGVLKSNVGYHIVKITDYREARLLGLDDPLHPLVNQTVREYIAQQLIANSQNQAIAKALNELVEELKAKADIKIFEENID